MKTNYQKSKSKNPNFFRRNLYAILLGVSIIVIAAIIITTFLVTSTGDLPTLEYPEDPPNGGYVVAPQPEFVMPVANVTLGQTAALDRLVWNRTLLQWRTFNGVDFLGQTGTEVRAIMDGTVTNVQNTIMDGTVVTISHGGGLVSEYMAMSSASVQIGQAVRAGDAIGAMGTSMVNSAAGSHLHLQMRQNGNLVDPLTFLPSIDK